MAMRGVLRPGEIHIRVMDMKKARHHYDHIMGLHEVMEDDKGRVYFKAWDEHDHHSIVLVPSDRPGMDHFAFKVYDDATLDTLEKKLVAFGIPVSHIAAGVYPKSGRRLSFVIPSGHTMHLYAHKEQIGNTLPTSNPGVVPDDGVVRGANICRLDHLLLGGVNLEECVKLFTEVFDFDLSEKLVHHEAGIALAVFLTCSIKPHDIAFLVAPGPADTDRLRRVATGRGERDGISADAVLDQMRAESAIGAFTTVEQIAWAIELLLAPEADALAGGTLFMDAGRRKGLP